MKKWRAYFDYLFFKGYQVGHYSGNYRGLPYLVPITYLGQVIGFNLYSIVFLIIGIFDYRKEMGHINKVYHSLMLIPVMLIIVLLYFYPKNRAREIIDEYEEWERKKGRGLKQLLVFLIYFILSAFFLFLSSLYMNRNGTS